MNPILFKRLTDAWQDGIQTSSLAGNISPPYKFLSTWGIKTKGEPKVLGFLLHELLILFVCYSPLPLNRGVTFVTRETWRKLLDRCINQEAYSLSYSKPTNNSYQSACELKFVKVWNLGFQSLWVTRGRFLVIRCWSLDSNASSIEFSPWCVAE